MFGDTITITINSVAKVLNRINQDSYGSEYFLRGTDDEFRLKIRHTSYSDRSRKVLVDRHNVELTQTVYAVAPATVNRIRKSYAVLENERADGVNDPRDFDLGFIGFFSSTNVVKLLNYES